jgi:hypothetical protein
MYDKEKEACVDEVQQQIEQLIGKCTDIKRMIAEPYREGM